jgi:hypothetical protein
MSDGSLLYYDCDEEADSGLGSWLQKANDSQNFSTVVLLES